jgi:hypothetical protein
MAGLASLAVTRKIFAPEFIYMFRDPAHVL